MPGVLTRKQCWRRQSSNGRREQHDFIYRDGCAQDSNTSSSNTRSLSKHSTPSPSHFHPHSVLHASGSATLPDQACKLDNTEEKTKLKSVMFNPLVHVILVPTIIEYEAAGLADSLWWRDNDYDDFKQSALQEVKEFMTRSSLDDSKRALKLLYEDVDSTDLKQLVEEDEKKKLEFDHQQQLFEKAKQENLIKDEAKNALPFNFKLDNTLQPSVESKADDKPTDVENVEIEVLKDSLKLIKDSMKRKSLSSTTAISEEKALNQQHVFSEPEITGFNNKTDVDIIRDKNASELLPGLSNCLELHNGQKIQQYPNHATPQGEQGYPRVLICS